MTLQTYRALAWSPAGILVGQANGRLLALSARGEVVFDAVISESHGITEVERLVDVVGRPWVDAQMMCAATFQGAFSLHELSEWSDSLEPKGGRRYGPLLRPRKDVHSGREGNYSCV